MLTVVNVILFIVAGVGIRLLFDMRRLNMRMRAVIDRLESWLAEAD